MDTYNLFTFLLFVFRVFTFLLLDETIRNLSLLILTALSLIADSFCGKSGNVFLRRIDLMTLDKE